MTVLSSCWPRCSGGARLRAAARPLNRTRMILRPLVWTSRRATYAGGAGNTAPAGQRPGDTLAQPRCIGPRRG
jgi:hypothetical protein